MVVLPDPSQPVTTVTGMAPRTSSSAPSFRTSKATRNPTKTSATAPVAPRVARLQRQQGRDGGSGRIGAAELQRQGRGDGSARDGDSGSRYQGNAAGLHVCSVGRGQSRCGAESPSPNVIETHDPRPRVSLVKTAAQREAMSPVPMKRNRSPLVVFLPSREYRQSW